MERYTDFQGEEKSIYDMKLNETLYQNMKWGSRKDITRVAGGWIYTFISRETHPNGNGYDAPIGCVFVPYSEEFQVKGEAGSVEQSNNQSKNQ